MSVCAVLVTYNRRALLEQALDRLAAQTRPADTVLVVDNASTDGTGEWLAGREGIGILRLPANAGGAGGFEAGLRRAFATGYDWYWLLDDDTFAEPETLAALLAAAERVPETPSIMTSAVRWKDGTLHPMNAPYPRWSRAGDTVAAVAAGLLPVRRATFVSTLVSHAAVERHGFPHGGYFIWHDDTEYTARVLRTGTGYLAPDSVAWHWTGRPYDVVSDARGRFYYKVRNHVWMMRGPAFAGPERIWVWWSLASAVRRYLATSTPRAAAVKTVARGLVDGVRQAPA